MTTNLNSVSLVLPGLLGPQDQYPLLEAKERPVLKNLTALLSRAKCTKHNSDDWLRTVFDLLLPQSNPARASIPYAAISAEHDQLLTGKAHCLRIDPVYLRIDMDSAILLAADELQLTAEEASELGESINQHLKDDGIQINFTHPQRWYLFLDSPAEISTTPLHRVIRKDIHGFLPTGNEQQYWRSLLNELQMLLYTHPVNQQRKERGQAPVNSVWFWGEGELPQERLTDFNEIYSDDPLVKILADFCAIPCFTLDQFVKNERADNKGKVLLVTSDLENYVHNQDIFAWIDALKVLDSSIFKSIRTAFKMKSLQQCVIYPGKHQRFEISSPQSRKWWKRTRPLVHFLNT